MALLKRVVGIGLVNLLDLFVAKHVGTILVFVVYLLEPVLQEFTIFKRRGTRQKLRKDPRMVGRRNKPSRLGNTRLRDY